MAEQKTPRLTKRMKTVQRKVDRSKAYPVDDALKLVKETATAKFDESVDVAVNLGIDAKKSDQTVRGSVVMPSGTGKTVRIAVFAQGDKAKQAKDAGADIVGFEDLAAKIKTKGFMEFDVVIASPDAMKVVGQLGQVLGPRGLMPNPKVGTVSADIAGAVKNAKAGQVQYRTDKAGIVQCTIGRASFTPEALKVEPGGADRRADQGEAARASRASISRRSASARRWARACGSSPPASTSCRARRTRAHALAAN
jgi:large subunit ribosomal protein L1